MKVEINYPPNIKEIEKAFKLTGNEIFTYGDTIYNPKGYPLGADLIKHEELHQTQQGEHPEKWWQSYLQDEQFRRQEEIAAHTAQLNEAKKYIKDRNELNNYKLNLAQAISGTSYGNIISKEEAFKLWTN